MEVNNEPTKDNEIILPTGSQMFWTAIGISLYVYIWILLITMENDSIHTKSDLTAVYTGLSIAFMLVHYLHVIEYDLKNMLHMINPFFLIRWWIMKTIQAIKKLNKYLDKIFD